MTLEDIWNTIKSHHHTYTIAKYNARMCGYELDEQMENLKKTSMFSLHKEDRQNRKDIKQKIKDKKSEIDGYQEKADGSKKKSMQFSMNFLKLSRIMSTVNKSWINIMTMDGSSNLLYTNSNL